VGGTAEKLCRCEPRVGGGRRECPRSVGGGVRPGEERVGRSGRGGPAPREKQPVPERPAREGVGELGIDSGRRLILLDGARDGATGARQEKMIATEKVIVGLWTCGRPRRQRGALGRQ